MAGQSTEDAGVGIGADVAQSDDVDEWPGERRREVPGPNGPGLAFMSRANCVRRNRVLPQAHP